MESEKDRLEKIIENMSKGQHSDDRLFFDNKSKFIRTESSSKNPDEGVEITPEDLKFSGSQDLMNKSSMVLLSEEIISEKFSEPGIYKTHLKCMDKGDVYSLLISDQEDKYTPCSLCISKDNHDIDPETFGSNDDHIRIYITANNNPQMNKKKIKPALGFIKQKNDWHNIPVNIISVKEELYSRFGGLIETNVISTKKVLIIAAGSVGSVVAVELAKAGIRHFILWDYDRLEVANISRHAAGLSDVGRYKVNVVAEKILNITPFAKVKKINGKVDWDNIDEVREYIKEADLVFCSPDNRECRFIVNRNCVEENTPCIFAGLSEKAYKGQIINFDPSRNSLCYQCFIGMISDITEDIGAPNDNMNNYGYGNHPAKVEPGLSNDIAPVNIMSVKLIIQHLLKDTTTALQSLDDDLIAPLYFMVKPQRKRHSL